MDWSPGRFGDREEPDQLLPVESRLTGPRPGRLVPFGPVAQSDTGLQIENAISCWAIVEAAR